MPARGPSAPHADPAARGHSSRTTRPLRAGTRTRQPVSRADGRVGVTRPECGASGSVRLKGASMAPQPPALLPSWPRGFPEPASPCSPAPRGTSGRVGEAPASPPAGCCLSGTLGPRGRTRAAPQPELREPARPPACARPRAGAQPGGAGRVARPERHSERGDRGARARRARGQGARARPSGRWATPGRGPVVRAPSCLPLAGGAAAVGSGGGGERSPPGQPGPPSLGQQHRSAAGGNPASR